MTDRRKNRAIALGFATALVGGTGCAMIQSPMPAGANIQRPLSAQRLPPPPAPGKLPEPPKSTPITKETPPTPAAPSTATLSLPEVIISTQTHFPLLYAVEQERAISAGQRTSAEGQFDTMFRVRGLNQGGTFANGRLDLGLEQALPIGGASVFSGWRLGNGDFPIYYGDRKTADGGEFRAGVTVPLFQNRDIDPRRARLRAAQITELLADPIIRRARLDFMRNAAQTYWSWVGAGAQYTVAAEVLQLARDRQAFIDEQRKEQLVTETVQVLNRRLIASREEQLLFAERQLQQSAVRLSLFLRNANGDPVIPSSDRLPVAFIDFTPTRPNPAQIEPDIAVAIIQRPETARFMLQKERAAVDLKLASNQLYPVVNVFAAAAQDAGSAKRTFTGDGPFSTERTTVEVGLAVEVPLQRRDAVGRIQTAQAQITQLHLQERNARDEITAQVQDAASELDLTYKRIEKARVELREAIRVRDLQAESFRGGQSSLVELNLQEVAAAEAKTKVVAILSSYFRAVAEYLAALGADPLNPSNLGGRVPPQSGPVQSAPSRMKP